jgi:hypothetical protein
VGDIFERYSNVTGLVRDAVHEFWRIAVDAEAQGKKQKDEEIQTTHRQGQQWWLLQELNEK